MSRWLLRTTRALRALAVASALSLAGLFVFVALLRITYPFELEWVEGVILDHVRVALGGGSIYGEPTVEFVPLHYPPLYYYASAGVAGLLGLDFTPLRLVSLLSSLGCAGLVFALVRRETGSPLPGLLSGSFYLASFERTGGWLDLARVDAFFMLFLAAGVYAVRFARGRAALVGAGALVTGALLSKQTALLVALPLAAHALLFDLRRGVWWVGSALLLWLAGLALLGATSNGYFYQYSFGIPRDHPIVWGQALGFWTEDLLPMAPACVAVALYLLAGGLRRPTDRRLFHAALLAGAAGAAWSIRSLEGAFLNDLIPVFFGIAVVSGPALAEGLAWAKAQRSAPGPATSWRRAAEGGIWSLVLLQFLLLAYDPRDHLPTAAQRAGREALLERLRAIDGEVFTPHHGYLAQMAGKRGSAHASAISDIYFDRSGPVAGLFGRRLGEALREQRFAAVIGPPGMGLERWLRRFYPRVERLPIDPAGLASVESGALAPELIYWKGEPR